MRTRRTAFHVFTIAALALSLLASAIVASAAPIGDDAFWRTWARTDKPVQDGTTTRTWMWGPEAYTDVMIEEYVESPGNARTVQYFDKSRMEISNPGGDPTADWYVSNGLLARELITGAMQIGDTAWADRAPAQVNVAGDPGDTSSTAPTYASFATAIADSPMDVGSSVTRQISRSGEIIENPSSYFAGYGVTHENLVPETNHTVASVFWDFLRTSGPVYHDGAIEHGPIFEPWFYATGLPITEPYWSQVRVDGTPKDVLVQCFERRCLTYTPSNAPEWQVEMGNVGQHYYRWRYVQWPGDVPAIGDTLLATSLQDWAVYEGTAWVDDALQITVEPQGNPDDGYNSGRYIYTTDSDYPGVFGDVIAGVDVRAVEPTPSSGPFTSSGCLLFRVEEAEDDDPAWPEHRYAFCKDNTGRVRVWYLSSNPNEGFQVLVSPMAVAADVTGETWNRLEVATRDATLWFLLDGNIVATIEHENLVAGEVGVEVSNYTDTTVAWQFQDLEVRAFR